MTYLDTLRRRREKDERNDIPNTVSSSETAAGYEKDEFDEKSPALLSPDEIDHLKARIVAVVTVDPLDFDRAEYDRLWERLHAHVDVGGVA